MAMDGTAPKALEQQKFIVFYCNTGIFSGKKYTCIIFPQSFLNPFTLLQAFIF
jgi:hypothetical protein